MKKDCNPNFPNFCPPPRPHHPPCMPPAPSVVQGESLYEAVNNLTNKVNICINTYNDVMNNCYETLHNLERAAEANGSYYGNCEVWSEEGYDATESATYTIIHKANIDRHGEPIRVKLHIAYNNTTNSGITQGLFEASKITYADKIFTAIPVQESGSWYGNVFWNEAPIPSNSEPTLYTMGFTRNGTLKVYSNTVSKEQLTRDTIVDSMGCSGVLIQNGQICGDDYFKNIPAATEQTQRVCVGQNMTTKEIVFLVCGSENDVNKKGLTSKKCAEILIQYGCDIAVEMCEQANAGACNKGSLMFIPDNNNVPSVSAFWYISRSCFYRNDYERELAELMQNYGQCIWETYLTKLKVDGITGNISDLKNKLEQEIQDRINGDNTLNQKIEEETENRITAINTLTQQINSLTERVSALETSVSDLQTKYNALTEQVGSIQSNISNLQKTIAELNTDLNNVKDLVQSIINGTEDINYLSLNGGTMEGNITMGNNHIYSDVTSPTNNEVVNKTYVDNAIENTTTTKLENYLPLDGGTLTGDLTIQTNLNIKNESNITSNGAINLSPSTNINVNNKQIKNLAEPVLNSDAATKGYVDAHGGGGGGEGYLPLSGGTMKGNINFNAGSINFNNKDGYIAASGNNSLNVNSAINMHNKTIDNVPQPTTNTQVANKAYVDSAGNGKYLSLSGGSMKGDINMSQNTLSNVRNPIQNNDAANKLYVDTAITTAGDGKFLPLSGGTMEGNITFSNANNKLNMQGGQINNISSPSAGTSAANKNYVDSTVQSVLSDYLPLSGGTMQDEINMSGNKITNLGDPTITTDAINMKYANTNFLRSIGGTMNGNIDMGGDDVQHQINNLAEPSSPQDAANKNYVDTKISSDLKNYLALSGGKMSGNISMNYYEITGLTSLPTQDSSAVSKYYVGKNFLHTSGGTMTGALQMGLSNGKQNKISFMANPTLPNDATTKQYVDEFSNVNNEKYHIEQNLTSGWNLEMQKLCGNAIYVKFNKRFETLPKQNGEVGANDLPFTVCNTTIYQLTGGFYVAESYQQACAANIKGSTLYLFTPSDITQETSIVVWGVVAVQDLPFMSTRMQTKTLKATAKIEEKPEAYNTSLMQSLINVSKMFLDTLDEKDSETILKCDGLIDGWESKNHEIGEVCTANNQTWECFQAHNNKTYPDINPDNPAWFTFWKPLHGKSIETAREFVKPTGAHDIYKTGEYCVYNGYTYLVIQDTNFSPDEYAEAYKKIDIQ